MEAVHSYETSNKPHNGLRSLWFQKQSKWKHKNFYTVCSFGFLTA
jgi:hypothetical protein